MRCRRPAGAQCAACPSVRDERHRAPPERGVPAERERGGVVLKSGYLFKEIESTLRWKQHWYWCVRPRCARPSSSTSTPRPLSRRRAGVFLQRCSDASIGPPEHRTLESPSGTTTSTSSAGTLAPPTSPPPPPPPPPSPPPPSPAPPDELVTFAGRGGRGGGDGRTQRRRRGQGKEA